MMQSKIMAKISKSTYDQHIEKMSSVRRKKFDQDYQVLLLSELLLAMEEKDYAAAQKLAQLAYDISISQ